MATVPCPHPALCGGVASHVVGSTAHRECSMRGRSASSSASVPGPTSLGTPLKVAGADDVDGQGQEGKIGKPVPLTPEQEEEFRKIRMKLTSPTYSPYLSYAIFALKPYNLPGLGTWAVDRHGRLYIDFDAIKDEDLDTGVFSLEHEVWHVLRKHQDRASNIGVTNQKAWNYAADAEINDGLAEPNANGVIINKTPDKWIMPEKLPMPEGEKAKEGDFAEEYYRKVLRAIEEQQKDQQEQQQGGGQGGQGQGESGDSSGDSDCEGDDSQESQGSGGQGKGQKGKGDAKRSGSGKGDLDDMMEGHSCGGGSGAGAEAEWELGEPTSEAPGLSEFEQEVIRDQTADEIRKYVQKHGRGSVPGGMVRWAEEQLGPPQVKWQRALRTSISKGVTKAKGQGDWDRKKPSRRHANSKFIMPSMVSFTPKIEAGVDTSGSVGDVMLGSFKRELKAILASSGVKSDGVGFFSVDAHATVPKKVRSLDDIKLQGGGGTDMRVAVRSFYTNPDGTPRRKKDIPDIGIVFTDGETPWDLGEEKPPHGLKIIVVIAADQKTRGEHLASQVPDWAEAIVMTV